MATYSEEKKRIYVYDAFTGDRSVLMGVLNTENVRGKELYSFSYDDDWLDKTHLSFPLDPELDYYPGRQYPQTDAQRLFGMFMDSCPDRWGRMLIRRAAVRKAALESKTPGRLFGSDYLLALYDETRMGGLRFKLDKEGPFMTSGDPDDAVPPIERLRDLETAAFSLSDPDDNKASDNIDLLIAPGSSLGGARPKANVKDGVGNIWIAKFPGKSDETDVEAWEMVAMMLAADCGIDTPEAKLERFSETGATLLTRRFDREGKRRVHYASAMTVTDRLDGDNESASYLEIADFIKMYGVDPARDLKELWKRIVFSMMISNTDDHLRNHGFLLERYGWRLSPVFDINPNEAGNGYLSLDVDGKSEEADPGHALEAASYYGLDRSEAEDLIEKMAGTISRRWRMYAKECGIPRDEIRSKEPAFAEAERISGK